MPPFSGAGKSVRASTGVTARSLATRKGRPRGSRKQSPVFSRTASGTPSTDSQHSGSHGVAFDAFMLAERNRPFAAGIEAAEDIAARLQQRQHIGERVHRPSRTI